MDGIDLSGLDLSGRVEPFTWPLCQSPAAAQLLGLALILLVGLALRETLWPTTGPRR